MHTGQNPVDTEDIVTGTEPSPAAEAGENPGTGFSTDTASGAGTPADSDTGANAGHAGTAARDAGTAARHAAVDARHAAADTRDTAVDTGDIAVDTGDIGTEDADSSKGDIDTDAEVTGAANGDSDGKHSTGAETTGAETSDAETGGGRTGDGGSRLWGGTTLAARRQARRTALLEAALDLIGEAGAAAVTMRAVCRRAGLTDRYFYESFTGRDDLLDTLYRQVADEFLDPMTAFAAAADYDRDRLVAATLVDKVLDDPRKSRLFLVEPYSSTGLGQTTIAVMPAFTRLLQDHLFSDITDPDQRRLAAVTMAAGNAGMFSAWLGGSLKAGRAQIIDHIVAVLTAYRSMYQD
ncbi:TetR/AcrR family transcriptional regulator [Nocardia aurantia]|uniref:HTH tetR-type domain-containing protein n=1 Tax=Nocardia aurantia TaxID=2585199 RepID=A0A7K0DXF3_9NOCA|nr:TetR/AcrR family transcriptional regulator [Nocardia aurantia]MQY30459.1 hypothetical protein [Nocardia aurantia]